MKKNLLLLIIFLVGLFTITGCSEKKYTLQSDNVDTINELRTAINESDTYGATTLSSDVISKLKDIVKNFNEEKEWFSSSDLKNTGYGKIADTDKYEITSICNDNYCATFKIEKDKDKYYLIDYSFENGSEKNNKLNIMDANSESYKKFKKFDMDIKLDKNGTATITETWIVNISQGSEGYHPYYNLGNASISPVSASMDGKDFTIENNWNESASLSEKAYKTGIYKPDNMETDVVFGISEYGEHTYKVTYKITNYVSNLNDSDMIYWQLFPSGFNPSPSNVNIKISGPNEFTDTLQTWVFGKKGEIHKVKNGSIYLTSNGMLTSEEYLTILVRFPANTFTTTSKINKDFNSYYSMAHS